MTKHRTRPSRLRIAASICCIAVCLLVAPVSAQVRGVYALGMTATNSGVTPEAGFTYTNQFLFYSRGELKDSSGHVTATGQNSVLMDMNSIVWVAKKRSHTSAEPSIPASQLSPLPTTRSAPTPKAQSVAAAASQTPTINPSSSAGERNAQMLALTTDFSPPLADTTPPPATTSVPATGPTSSPPAKPSTSPATKPLSSQPSNSTNSTPPNKAQTSTPARTSISITPSHESSPSAKTSAFN